MRRTSSGFHVLPRSQHEFQTGLAIPLRDEWDRGLFALRSVGLDGFAKGGAAHLPPKCWLSSAARRHPRDPSSDSDRGKFAIQKSISPCHPQTCTHSNPVPMKVEQLYLSGESNGLFLYGRLHGISWCLHVDRIKATHQLLLSS